MKELRSPPKENIAENIKVISDIIFERTVKSGEFIDKLSEINTLLQKIIEEYELRPPCKECGGKGGELFNKAKKRFELNN